MRPELSRRGGIGAVLVVLLALVPAAGSSAHAGGRARIALSASFAPPGTLVHAQGRGFPGTSRGRLLLGRRPIGTFHTGSLGGFDTRFTVADRRPGTVRLTAVAGNVVATRRFGIMGTTASDPPVLFGASTSPGPSDFTELDAFEAAAGKHVRLFNFYQGWPYSGFNATEMSAIAARGAIPMVTWEPWDYTKGVRQPLYTLNRIANGAYDTYIRNWATAAKAWGGRIFLRFAHEMNGNWYPWCEGVNGNKPGSYVKAWRHVHGIFTSVGATNVQWIWSPNVVFSGSTPFSELYPGDAYVDWVALDGYNGGTALNWGGWLSFGQIFDASLAQLRSLAPTKPIMIAEVASAEAGGSKAAWITDFFAALAADPDIKAFDWFNWNRETDWRIQSSPAAAAAFAAGVADPRYGS